VTISDIFTTNILNSLWMTWLLFTASRAYLQALATIRLKKAIRELQALATIGLKKAIRELQALAKYMAINYSCQEKNYVWRLHGRREFETK
jgi:hypothetical protein